MKRILITAGAVALALITTTAAAAQAEPLPTFDFTDCPAIPAKADPAKWRCEVLIASGTIRIGQTQLRISRLRTVFAEGTIDGQHAQAFGSMSSEPIRVPGGTVRVDYAGYADFLSVGDRMGEQHVKLTVRSPFLPRTCTVGSDRDPIILRPLRTAGPDVLSTQPLVVRFSMRDNEFTVPRARGCGPLTHRLGVPSADNDLTLTTYAGIRPYATP